jgi:predicted membrane-bound spermidine synthase
MNQTPTARVIGRTALLVIFTLSGFSGLIYESIWSHYLKLFLGHAAYAQTLVLTVFMGGMALGAWLAARYSPRLRNLLLIYALVEGVTGLIALGFHPIYLASTGFTFETIIPALGSPGAINLAKWSIATLLILPQSVLLGSTFPLISGAIVRRFPERPGTTLAMLYFTNCLGAAIGVLTSGFLLIGWIGLPGTVVTAGAVNIAIAAVVWRWAGGEPPPPPLVPAVTQDDLQLQRRVLLAALLSGAAAFIYEIAWIRMLSMVLGSSTHAFELMLSAFILGLAFGGWWIRRRIDSLAQPFGTLAIMFALMAVLAACTIPAYGYTFEVIGAAVRNLQATDDGYRQFNLVSHGVAALVMIPTTFIAGMTLPVMTHVLLRRADERAIGRVYASNTIGAIVGVLLAVHLLLPAVGVKGAVIVGALLQFGIAALFLWRQPASSVPRVRMALATSLVLVGLIAAFIRLDPMRTTSGVYRHGETRLPDDMQVVFLRDGKTSTISLARRGPVVSIATNGKPDASINMGETDDPTADEITMVMAGALPLAIHPAPRYIANIGLGSGLTSSTVLADPAVIRLDSIEIEPVMAQAARLGFGPRVRRLFEDPRSHLHFEDAKTFFSAAGRRYDVIISEPSNPWVSGVATLFSDEFYAQVVGHLNPDGLLVQWIQIYETDITVVASILKALGDHFDDYVVYGTDDSNILIAASPQGALPAMRRNLLEIPALAAELRSAGIQSMGDIEVRRIASKRLLQPFMAAMRVPANSDFRPYVDLNAPRMRFLHRDALAIVELGLQPVPLADIFEQPLSSPPVSDSPSSARYYTRHRAAIEARGVVRAVMTSDTSPLRAELRGAVDAVRATAAACQDPAARTAWLDSVHTLATITTPVLTPTERIPMWQALRNQGCATQLRDGEEAWFGILDGGGRGDARLIAAQGELLFTRPLPALSGNQVLEALIATAAAKTAIGRGDEARALLQANLPNLQNAGRLALALSLVASQAGTRPPL